ncbi:MAG: hypothetical protein N3C12_04670 [Candidatus Binatia bacterium]|nr:hypothetical protein [Candidatus Binatia bacterium]
MEECSRTTQQLVGALLFGLVSAIVASGCSRSDAGTAAQPVASTPLGQRFDLAARALLEKVAHAMCRQDRSALEQLLVSDEEYQEVILPGSGSPGEPAARMPGNKAQFFTRMHKTKNQYALQTLLAACSLGNLRLQAVELPSVPEQRAGYTLYREPKLRFLDAEGNAVELRPGSVVEFGGRVKMLSYFVD